jgi:hypothetical protein
MADPISLQILEAIRYRLTKISVAAGYNTTPCSVRLGTQSVLPEDVADGPVISVFDLGDSAERSGHLGSHDSRIEIVAVVEGVQVNNGAEATESLHLLIQDIHRAVFLAADTRLSGLVLGVERGDRTVIYPDAGGNLIGVRQEVRVSYLETYGNP